MGDLGRINDRTARLRAKGALTGSFDRKRMRSSTDSHGRAYGHDDHGRVYSPCPMCSERSMVDLAKRETGRALTVHTETIRKCLNCGYVDSDVAGALV